MHRLLVDLDRAARSEKGAGFRIRDWKEEASSIKYQHQNRRAASATHRTVPTGPSGPVASIDQFIHSIVQSFICLLASEEARASSSVVSF